VAVALTVAIDLFSKTIAFEALGGGPPADLNYTEEHIIWVLPGAFRFIPHYNMGGAFGMASGNIWLFLAATAVLVPALVMTAYYSRDPETPLWSLGLVVGGALGNLYDRLFHVGVRDFLEIVNPRTGGGLWPVFNIADIAIVVGVLIYLVWTIIDSARKRRIANAQKEGE